MTGLRSTWALNETPKAEPSPPEIWTLPLGPDPSARPERSMEAVNDMDSPPPRVPDCGEIENAPAFPLVENVTGRSPRFDMVIDPDD